MQTPLKLEMHGSLPAATVRTLVTAHVRKLEARYGRITSCAVVVRAPGAHHRMGEPYTVGIHLALPSGRDVVVGRPPRTLDRRQGDVKFAINDAFRRALNQLQSQARRLRGDVKHHERTSEAS